MDSEYEGVTAKDDLDIVGLVNFAVFVNDEEGDMVPAGIAPEARRDFMDGAVCCGLDSPEVMVVEGLAARGGNVWRLHPFDSGERNLIMLDGISGKRTGRVGTCGDVP